MTRTVSGPDAYHAGYLTNGGVSSFPRTVLTKVFVYCGIAFLAVGGMPVFFELIGWGMRIQ